jgi:hypothetical protein
MDDGNETGKVSLDYMLEFKIRISEFSFNKPEQPCTSYDIFVLSLSEGLDHLPC